MKVLHVIPSLSSTEGGPSKALPLMAEALHRRGIEITIATTDDAGPGRRDARLTNQVIASEFGPRRYFRKQTDFYKVSFPLRRWVQESVKDFDVVNIHALFSFTSVEAAAAARAAGVPYVIRPLGVLNQYGVGSRRRLLKGLSIKLRESKLLRDAAAIHFTSEAEKTEAEMLGIPMRSHVIPLGIPFAEQRSFFSDRKPYLLFLSRIDPKKNIESLLDAWSQLKPTMPLEWRLKIAGDGSPDYLSALKDRSRALGIDSTVEWVGYVEGEQKERLLREASIFILPSFSENFGIAAVEAMAAGVPSILAKGVAVGEQSEKSGACRLIEPEPNSTVSAISDLVKDTATRELLSVNGQEFASRVYSLEKMGDSLEKLYREIVSC